MNYRSYLFSLIYLISAVVGCVVWAACATPGSPTGGPRDETPPQLDTLNSTPNYQTNFKKQRLEFTFNEWVKLDNVVQQVVVSPPMINYPELSIRKKTVRFEFPPNEELKPNATYTINFGEAVKDITESNPVENFVFVFSTGDHIDSLSVNGNVVDAFTGKPVEGALVMLYDHLADSVVRTTRPFYFAKTDKDGKFQINNLRADTFKVFALQEEVQDYLFNIPVEPIGFPDNHIVVNDSSNTTLQIRLSTQVLPLNLKNVQHPYRGFSKLVFNREPFELQVSYDTSELWLYKEINVDTVAIWHENKTGKPDSIYLRNEEDWRDTVALPIIAGDEKTRFRLVNKAAANSVVEIKPAEPLVLVFNHPLKSIDTSGIHLLADTTLQAVNFTVEIDAVNRRQLKIKHLWKEDTPYILVLDSMAVFDYKENNLDTIRQSYRVLSRKTLSHLNLSVKGLDPAINYIAELIGKNNLVIKRFIINGEKEFNQRVINLSPGNYSLRIIEDINGNGRWDPAHYDTKRQPEKLFIKELEELRANWEVDAQITPVL